MPPVYYRQSLSALKASGLSSTIADALDIDVESCKVSDILKRHEAVYRTVVDHDAQGHHC